MGNCGSCGHARSRPSLTPSLSSFDSFTYASRRNPLIHRFTRMRTFSPYNLNALIDETLLMIRTVAENDQEPPHAMFLVSRIANREDRWLDVMMALIEHIPINDPLGATVIALLLDECSLPSRELLEQLITRICSNNRWRMKQLQMIVDECIKEVSSRDSHTRSIETSAISSSHETELNRVVASHHDTMGVSPHGRSPSGKIHRTSGLAHLKYSSSSSQTLNTYLLHHHRKLDNDLRRDRNTLVLLGCLAEKLVGSTSASMLNTIALKFLIDRAYLGIYGYKQLNTAEPNEHLFSPKYALVLKIILFALIAIEKFSHTSESKHILLQSLTIDHDQSTVNLLEYYEPWIRSENCLRRQIGFYAQWLLDNVFILEHRRPSYETIDCRHINVILNDKDMSEYLKLGSDGLEARSDTVSFESVRCTYHVNAGVWYYEVLIITDGVMQIGWATKQSKFMNHEGYGIGDDHHSVAYDGCRNLIWFDAKSIPHANPSWKPGDVLGCLIDFDHREVIFSLNGHSLDPFRKLFTSSSHSPVDGYFAAASFMSYQHCRFNFGSVPFRHPPTTVNPFQTFNQHAHLSDAEKYILPRFKKLELLRSMPINEHDCIICADLPANTVFKPCQHQGFCQACSSKLDLCPICRSVIRERFTLTH